MGRVCAEDRVCSLSAVHSERARWLLYEGGATRGGPPATWPGPGPRALWLFTCLEPQVQPSPLPPAEGAGPRGV